MRAPPGRAWFVRRGIIRYGLPIGTIVTAWVVVRSAGELDHLRSRAGWLRLATLLVLGAGEWILGLGWVIGQALWYLHGHSLDHHQPLDRRSRR